MTGCRHPGDPALKPAPSDIRTSAAHAQDLLRIRRSSPLFTLGSAKEVMDKVSFPLGGPTQSEGVIVMRITDTKARDVDPRREGLVVVFNASDESTTQTVPGTAGTRYRLHPVQADGSDPVVQGAVADTAAGTFTVPARTVAVFETR